MGPIVGLKLLSCFGRLLLRTHGGEAEPRSDTCKIKSTTNSLSLCISATTYKILLGEISRVVDGPCQRGARRTRPTLTR